MKIELETGYKIESDGTCVVLYKLGKEKDDGTANWYVTGYYPRLSQALDRLLEERISDSEARTLTDLLDAIRCVEIENRKIVQDIVSNYLPPTKCGR